MKNNLLDLLAEEISGVLMVFNIVIIRMIKDKEFPYILILLDNEKSAVKYNAADKIIDNINFDFNKKQELLCILNEKNDELKSLWKELEPNENINGLYSK